MDEPQSSRNQRVWEEFVHRLRSPQSTAIARGIQGAVCSACRACGGKVRVRPGNGEPPSSDSGMKAAPRRWLSQKISITFSAGQVRILGRWQAITPAQEARLAVSVGRMREALRAVQKREPNWKPTPQVYETVEGLIRANEATAQEALLRALQLRLPRTGIGPCRGVGRCAGNLQAA